MSTDLKIKYQGQAHEIDANVFINSLLHTTTLIQEINRELNTGAKIEVKIKALEKGSFLVHIQLIETVIDSLKNIFTAENIAVGGTIIGGLVGLVELKKFLKGDKPEVIKREGEDVTIKNGKGDITVFKNFTVNMYQTNQVARDSLEQGFETLNNDPSIDGIEFTDVNEKPLLTVNRDDFGDLITRSEEILNGDKITTKSAKLNIVRLSFDENLNWEFYYHGNKIGARIKDPSFFEKINNGETFAKGDTLEVELQIRQKFDSTVNTYINKSYQVNRIINHFPRDEQQKLDFERN
ncbi:hypothetical protein [Maribellus sp. YY47]|uniref:hypothetical protein n=1 Tax=Maribellus sp. YY47 TaxID=2929486 RepID=UPI00200075BD|nr:hypothetical protein [Maribellus sp. YY47]MCK3683991.1 hypothetical protein [Maribellus sp. YY47]